MSDNSSNDTDRQPTRQPFQFSLRTMFVITTAFAVLCGLIAWWGAIVLILVIACGAGMFAGLILCPVFGLECGLGDLRWDAAKCLLLATLIVFPAYLLGSYGLAPHALISVAVVAGFGVKATWSDLDLPEVMVVVFTALAAIAVAASICIPFVRD